ncbi:MAG TPA: hypothetical protein VIN07_07975 [Flavipsychrobacter sp.]
MHLHPYKSKSGKQSGVTGFYSGPDYIVVRFQNGEIYKYSYSSCGAPHVETMKELAAMQQGLSTYIAQQKPQYTK